MTTQVVAIKILHLVVCSDEGRDAAAKAARGVPCGTTGGWQFATRRKGQQTVAKCEENPKAKHYLFQC